MLKYVKDYSTFRFFEFYCMLYMRKHLQQEGSNKIMLIGYYPIFNVLNYIKFEKVYDLLIKKYCGNYCDDSEAIMYEDVIEISCEATVGIEVNYINDPVNCLDFAYKNGCIVFEEEDLSIAACNGHIKCLKYLHDNGCEWHTAACDAAAEKGHLKCLKFLHENGCPWDDSVCYFATINNHLDCLIYAYENGCSWDKIDYDFATRAVENNSIECLLYIYKNGCAPKQMNGYKNYYDNSDNSLYEFIFSEGDEDVALRCVKYCIENGHSLDDEVWGSAIMNGKYDCIEYAYAHGYIHDYEDEYESHRRFFGEYDYDYIAESLFRCVNYMMKKNVEMNKKLKY